MFNINSKVVDKEGKEGFITHRIGNVYVVNTEENNMITAKTYREEELTLKECSSGINGACDNSNLVIDCSECLFRKEVNNDI